MSLPAMLRSVIVPIHPDGWKFVAIFAVGAVVLALIAQPLGWIGAALTAWCIYFFRDPPRVTPVRPGLVISPADGVVQAIGPAEPPPELGMERRALTRVSIFMNVFDVHVNRSPVDAEVADIAYRPGKFFNASLDKASEENERNALRLRISDGRELVVVQIAGSGGASHPQRHQAGRHAAGGRALRPDPLRQPRRCLSARRRGAAGHRRAARRGRRNRDRRSGIWRNAKTGSDPMTERERPPRLRDQSINRLIPNMLTVMALCAGLTSMLYALQGRWEPAVIAIVAAGVLDGLDGRIARLLNGQSKFGAELDSLSDFISFGVAPALLLYQWQLAQSEGPGLGGDDGLRRLLRAPARPFQHQAGQYRSAGLDQPLLRRRSGAGGRGPGVDTRSWPAFELGPGYVDHPLFVGAVELVVALLMVSRLPTYSIKRIRIPHRHVMAALLVFGLLAATLVSIPWITLLGVGAVYIGSMPLAVVAHRRLSAQQPLPNGAETDVPRDTPVE